jgi:hypothetical protein
MTCVAMGHPDEAFPANAVRSDRQPNSDFVRYVGFAEEAESFGLSSSALVSDRA